MNLRETYDAAVTGWDRRRSRALFERRWLEQFLALAPEGAVPDLGCGAGEPIAAYLAAGRRVTGVDFSKAMLAVARERLPSQEWNAADMRGLDLGRRFGGVIA